MKETGSTHSRVLKLIDAALSLQQAGEWAQSNTILHKAGDFDPGYAPTQLLLGINHQALGNVEAAERCLRQALRLDPDYGEAHQTLGLLLADQGRLEEAIPLLRTRWAQDPGNPHVLEALSSALLQVGEEVDAIRVLRKAWEQTQAEEPGVLYGRFLIQLGRLEEAETVLREVEATCPCPRTMAELSLVLLLQNRDEEAADVLEQAIELDPTFDRAWRGLAGCYDRLGKHQRALEAAEQALRLDAEHCRNWLVKAGALLSLEQYEEALDAARHGMTFVDPEDEETRAVLFQLYEQEMIALVHLERFDEALHRLAENQQRFPARQRFAEVRARLLLFNERYGDALAVVETAEAHGVIMLPMKYYLLHLLGRVDEAWACIQPDLEGAAPDVLDRRLDVLSKMAFEAYGRGEFDAAYTILAQLQSFAPDDPRLLNNLGFMLIGRGDLALAERYLTRVVQLTGSEDWTIIAALNLAYLYLIQRCDPEAEQALDTAKASLAHHPDTDSIARIAYWHNGEVIPEYTAYPFELYPCQLSIWANRAALCLARGDEAEAEALAHQLVEDTSGISLGYRVLGWVLRAEERPEAARRAWQHARERAEHPEEKEILTTWLDDLPDTDE
jgi:tetratricopeptide (TPR) repeat protein